MGEQREKRMRVCGVGPRPALMTRRCGIRSPRYCRPGAHNRGKPKGKKRRRERRERATPSAHAEAAPSTPSRNAARILFVSTCLCAHESSRQTNNLPFARATPPPAFASSLFLLSVLVFSLVLPVLVSLSFLPCVLLLKFSISFFHFLSFFSSVQRVSFA